MDCYGDWVMACKAVRQCPMHIEYEPGMNQDKAKDSIVKANKKKKIFLPTSGPLNGKIQNNLISIEIKYCKFNHSLIHSFI